MAGINIKISGLDKSLKDIDKLRARVDKSVNDEINAFGQNTVNQAKRLCPVDEGFLRNSITYARAIKKGSYSVDVIVAADYAAYVEFGTRKFAAAYVATLPTEWKTFAAQYKGKAGGSFDDFVMRIAAWMKRKNIGATYDIKTRRRTKVGKQSADTTLQADAYAMALYIVRHGTKPHPYLVPAVENNKKILVANLKETIKLT